LYFDFLYNFFSESFFVRAGGKIEKNEIGGACGAYGGGEKYA
jgi:hypothetical protein